jgi:antitoxin component YwqK of YwqJK toxin-antitoxin module
MKLLLTLSLYFTSHFCYAQNNTVLYDTLGADSIVQVYHNNGQLFFQVPYKAGKQNGWYEQHHDNGAICTKDFRINGKTVDGYHVILNDNGGIYQKGFYKNGHQIGKWYCYTSQGEPFKIYIYDKKGNWVKLKVWNSDNKKWVKSRLY